MRNPACITDNLQDRHNLSTRSARVGSKLAGENFSKGIQSGAHAAGSDFCRIAAPDFGN
jgi:hypothetical protein